MQSAKEKAKSCLSRYVRKIPEQILNKTLLKFSIHVPNLPRTTSEIIQDTYE